MTKVHLQNRDIYYVPGLKAPRKEEKPDVSILGSFIAVAGVFASAAVLSAAIMILVYGII